MVISDGSVPAGIVTSALRIHLVERIHDVIGSQDFRTYLDPRTKTDLLDDGRLSCAKVVSAVLHRLDSSLCRHEHATVAGTLVDLQACGWTHVSFDQNDRERVSEIMPAGAVLIWEATEISGGHEHIGFAYQWGHAVSNCSVRRVPVAHKMFMHPDNINPRNIIHVLWNKRLGDSTSFA